MLLLLCGSLLLVLLSSSPRAVAGSVTCEKDADCSLNGQCKSGASVATCLHTFSIVSPELELRLEWPRGLVAAQAAATATHPGRPALEIYLGVGGWILYPVRNLGAMASLPMSPRGEATPSSSKGSTTFS